MEVLPGPGKVSWQQVEQPRHRLQVVEAGPQQEGEEAEAEEQEVAAVDDKWEEVDSLHKPGVEAAGNLHMWHNTTDCTTGHSWGPRVEAWGAASYWAWEEQEVHVMEEEVLVGVPGEEVEEQVLPT